MLLTTSIIDPARFADVDFVAQMLGCLSADFSYSLNVAFCCSASNKMRPDGRPAPARRPPAAHRIALAAAASR
jgi:hypothetical protein